MYDRTTSFKKASHREREGAPLVETKYITLLLGLYSSGCIALSSFRSLVP